MHIKLRFILRISVIGEFSDSGCHSDSNLDCGQFLVKKSVFIPDS